MANEEDRTFEEEIKILVISGNQALENLAEELSSLPSSIWMPCYGGFKYESKEGTYFVDQVDMGTTNPEARINFIGDRGELHERIDNKYFMIIDKKVKAYINGDVYQKEMDRISDKTRLIRSLTGSLSTSASPPTTP